MAFFNEFPGTRSYDSDLGWCIAAIEQIINKLGGFDQITFADPITWSITTQYAPFVIVREGADGGLYISKKPVPAGIALSNTEYWESLGVYDTKSDVIINVADYGALGVDGADYTAQLTEAFAAGNIIYFPEGTYSFGTIAVNKPLYIFGAGAGTVWKPLHRTEYSNQYKTMLQSSNDLTLDNIHFVGDNSIASQTGDKYYQTAIVQQYGARFVMRRCFINDIYDDYHLSQGDLEFYARNGLLLYVSDADYAEISDCNFGTYGGEELILISRAVAKFGDRADVVIRSNHFMDRVSIAGGGTLDGGSAINVIGGQLLFENNIINNYYERGSFVNLLAANTEACNNICTNSDQASFLDFCEGYYIKSNLVYCHDNYFEDKNGVTSKCIKAQARQVIIENNHLEGLTAIHTFMLTAEDQVSYQVYKPSYITWADYEEQIIRNNTIVITQNATSATSEAGVSIGQTNQTVGSRGTLKRFIYEGNSATFKEGLTSFVNLIFILSHVIRSVFKNNIFPRGAVGAPSSARNVNISYYTEPSVSGDMIIVDGNVFDNSAVNTAGQVIQGNANAAANQTIVATHNTMISTALFDAFASSVYTNVSGDYNYNFSTLSG